VRHSQGWEHAPDLLDPFVLNCFLNFFLKRLKKILLLRRLKPTQLIYVISFGGTPLISIANKVLLTDFEYIIPL